MVGARYYRKKMCKVVPYVKELSSNEGKNSKCII